MKIICVDNFDRENVDDTLIAENVSEHFVKVIVEPLNEKFSGSVYFRAVPDDHKLHVFES